MRAHEQCFSCGAIGLQSFYEQRDVPLDSRAVYDTRAEALDSARGDIRLSFCRRCGFIENVLFDEGLVASAVHWTPEPAEPDAHVQGLASALVRRYRLRHKDVLDIGSRSVGLLEALCRLGDNSGVGIAPAYRSADASSGIRLIPDAFSEKHVELWGDFICCIGGLDGIQAVREQLSLVRRCIGERHDPVVFFEVADGKKMLQELAFWEIAHQRCSYFSLGSLARVFRAADFDVFDLRNDRDGRSLLIDAVATNGSEGPYWEEEDDLEELSRLAGYFHRQHVAKRKKWLATLSRLHAEGRRAVLWGAPASATGLLTGVVDHTIEYVIDVDASHPGAYISTGQRLEAPSFLQEYRPDVVIATGADYVASARQELAAQGLQAELLAP